MKKVAELLNRMVEEGVITDYAVFGAVAQMRYTESVATMDAGILVSIPSDDDLVVITPIYDFCASLGYLPEGDAIRVGVWPVQFIPSFNQLTKDAMIHAEYTEIDSIGIRVVQADYLAVIALSVGRNKDFLRILSLLESDSVTVEAVSILAEKYSFHEEWLDFKKRFIDEK